MRQKLLLFSISVLVLNFGCKKGDGDAVISIKSREARLVGVWEVESWNNVTENNSSSNHQSRYSSVGITSTNSYATTNYASTTENINGNSVSYTIKSNSQQTQSQTFSIYVEDNSKSGSGTIKISIEFEKDGSFKRTIEYSNLTFVNNKKISGSGFNDTLSIISTESLKTELSGRWEFLGGVPDEFKNKERVILHVLNKNLISSYADNFGESDSEIENKIFKDGEYTEIWKLETLRNKEMVFEAESFYSSTINTGHTENQAGSLTETSYSLTSSQTGRISGALKQ